MTIHKISICRFERKKIMEIENTIKEEIAKLLAKDEFLNYEEAKYYAIIEHQKNKSKFFALYFDQMVYVIDYNDKPIVYRNFGNRADEQMKGMYKDAYLLLTPLSQISDEDAIEVAKLLDFHDGDGLLVSRYNTRISMYDRYNDNPEKQNVLHLYHSILEVFSLDENGKVFQYDFDRLIIVYNYLLSRGYYVGDGTEVEYGWCKLTKKRPNN